jgi:hypothetical protein
MTLSTTRARWRRRLLGAGEACIKAVMSWETTSVSCEIFHVPYNTSFRWKWRAVDGDGSSVEESQESYELFYECVCAARASGYQPQIKCR